MPQRNMRAHGRTPILQDESRGARQGKNGGHAAPHASKKRAEHQNQANKKENLRRGRTRLK
jgi:hypothetical protein